MNYGEQIKLLQSAGVSYFNYGIYRLKGKKLFDWYLADYLTENQMEILRKGGATLRGVGSTYAPELRRALVCFDTKSSNKE